MPFLGSLSLILHHTYAPALVLCCVERYNNNVFFDFRAEMKFALSTHSSLLLFGQRHRERTKGITYDSKWKIMLFIFALLLVVDVFGVVGAESWGESMLMMKMMMTTTLRHRQSRKFLWFEFLLRCFCCCCVVFGAHDLVQAQARSWKNIIFNSWETE